jgi:hypothetical protein
MVCPTCQGKDGAHFGFCFLAQFFSRILGPDFPMFAPEKPEANRSPLSSAMAEASGEASDQLEAAADEPTHTISPSTLPVVGKVVHAKKAGTGSRRMYLGTGRGSDSSTWSTVPPGEWTLPPHPEPDVTGLDGTKGRAKKIAWSTRENARHPVFRFLQACVTKQPGHYETTGDLYAAYDLWRQVAGDAELTPRMFNQGLSGMELAGRQGPVVNGSKPVVYYGLKLKPEDQWNTRWTGGQDREPESPEEDERARRKREVAELRSLMARAKRQPPAPEPAPAPVVEKAIKATNNGWHTVTPPANTPDTASAPTEAPDLSEFQQPTVTRTRRDYKGDLPGREIPKAYKDEIVKPLIEQGWTYRKANSNGKGKPRIINPQGRVYTLAKTPSDVKGLMFCKTQLKVRLGAAL